MMCCLFNDVVSTAQITLP